MDVPREIVYSKLQNQLGNCILWTALTIAKHMLNS